MTGWWRDVPHPWRLEFADHGGTSKDEEVRMRSYANVVNAAVKAGELSWRYNRTMYIVNVDTGAKIEVRRSGQVRVIREG